MMLLSGVALAQVPAQPQQPMTWEKLPRMQLETSFAGPMQDTAIQRWRDTSENVICYIYMPISTQHSAPSASGYVTYGPNQIGSISCVPGRAPVNQPRAAAPPAKKTAPREVSRPQPLHEPNADQ
jgi:hypothetical protein